MSRKFAPISHPPGVPRWFTRVLHWAFAWGCNRYGHEGPGVCGQCGQILDMDLARKAGVPL